jgi:ribosome biogenesis GTPase A
LENRLEDDEGLVLTPFEKNLEVWRQLWRVLERSDIVVQVSLNMHLCVSVLTLL